MGASKTRSSTEWFDSLPDFSTGIVATSAPLTRSLTPSRRIAESLIGGLPIPDAAERVDRLTARLERLHALDTSCDDPEG